MTAPTLPPLLTGREAPSGGTVMARAVEAARSGEAGAGTLIYRHRPDRWSVALVLEPDVDAVRSAAMLPLAQLALVEALAQLAPAGTEVRARWTGAILVNGGACGGASGTMAAGAEPGWLVAALDMPLMQRGDPGENPDRTALHDEIGPVEANELTETVARHWLLWLHRWEADGLAPLARAWSQVAADMGGPIEARRGTGTVRGRFLGLDDEMGALVATDGDTVALPLIDLWARA